MQIENGAHMIQLFDAMCDFITPDNFNKFAMPCIQEIATEMRKRYPEIPLMVFTRGAKYAIPDCQRAGYDVMTLDLR